MAEWLFRQNYTENKDEEIEYKKLCINTIRAIADILLCLSTHNIQEATRKRHLFTESIAHHN